MQQFALLVVIAGWKRVFRWDTKTILTGLLLVTLFYNLALFLKWSGINTTLALVEDSMGVLLPLWWAFLVYALFQEAILADSRSKQLLLSKEVAERASAEQTAMDYSIKLASIVENFHGGLLMETAERRV